MADSVGPPGNSQQTAARLRALLAQPGRYRRQWMQQAQRMRPGQINESAVARVIAEYLKATGQLELGTDGYPMGGN